MENLCFLLLRLPTNFNLWICQYGPIIKSRCLYVESKDQNRESFDLQYLQERENRTSKIIHRYTVALESGAVSAKEENLELHMSM